MTETGTGTPPCVDCTADADGTLTFDLAAAGATALVLKRRKADDRVALALTAAPGDRLRAVLRADAVLAEGRWDAFTDGGPAGEQRAEPGLRDLRKLVDRTPEPEATGVVAHLPYRTADGRLAIRSWTRSPHAEAGDLTVGGGALTLEGRLYGAELGPESTVEARLRGTRGQAYREPVTDGGDGRFRCTLPYGPLAAGGTEGTRVWDLWLLPTGAPDATRAAGTAVRIGRILDDIADRKSVHVYPAASLGGDSEEPDARATPYYTVDNDLSVRLERAKG
ncbi:transferase [Streptomyces sp. NBC_01387]|uniref:transferase n=1 Tax=Streptomyces sp. NBC_01387 TaxID=2903849 RepID=UPI003255B363